MISNQPGHRQLPVNRLVVLPFKTSVSIAFESIRVRFFRSAITTMSLVLAVSFFSFINVNIDITSGLLATGDPLLRPALVRSGYDLEAEDTSAASSPKQRWLVALSLLVCMVGIVNAQLMAVTERFREIGTMKCLGALDRFILRLFLLEAGIQGLIGGGLGAVVGGGFSLINAWIRIGPVSIASLSWASAAQSVCLATGIGFILSLIGVLYPAVVASRMRPVEAMRVEQ